ncbi:hypothetical protein YPPY66_4127, partial [Yersinia pestis PY-66]
MRKEQGTSLS